MQGFPINFAKQNGLNKERQEIFLMNGEGKTWESELKRWGDCRLSIVRGWTSFCTANKLEVGDSCTFRLLQKTAETPVFQLCSSIKSERKIQSAEGCIDDKTGGSRFVKLTPTLNSLHLGKQVTFQNHNLGFFLSFSALLFNSEYVAASTGKFHEREQTHKSGEDSSGGQKPS